ncbi:MAG: rRNA maturation RNase YbeY [Gammaproteobacteria bacterium]|nr:MAG: rRNA maturation RNase YbeY [Pseudomonadota bacterium]PIE37888.1 MAG: rRNA maturation RNase YbeY [Gammaproteobacteria bacterium]
MPLHIDLQHSHPDISHPEPARLACWANAALRKSGDWDVTIRIVDIEEITQLNSDYRQKHDPTNVLSFPFEAPPEVRIPLLGDLIICAEIVENEALEQKKAPEAHWAHMVIHGMLHLQGFDHISESEAEEMEQLETSILNSLGYPDPYKDNSE